MKKALLMILTLLLFTSCSQKEPKVSSKNFPIKECTQVDSPSLDKEIIEYQELVEKCLVVRKSSINYINELNQSKPIDGKDIDNLRLFTKKHLDLREEFYKYINKYACLMEKNQPSSLAPKERLKAGMIALSSALILYDNYLLGISLYEKDERLRRIINSKDKGYDIHSSSLLRISESYSSDENRKKLTDAIKYYKSEIKQI